MSLETIEGNLRDAYKQLQPSTMLHVDELMDERRTNKVLRDQWFYTADGEIYFLNGARKTPTLAMTREAHNPVLRNIDDAFEQLTQNYNYRPSQTDVQQALDATETVLMALPSLRLSDANDEWKYLAVGTTPAKYDKLNEEERKLAERAYGQGNDFAQNMKMLKDAQIGETQIYVLNPEYVRKHAEAGAIARASWLIIFCGSSRFSAGSRGFGVRSRVRGVRREVVAEGGAQKNQGPYRTPAPNGFIAHYDALLADPEGAVKALDNQKAAGLANLLQNYLSTRGQ